MQKELNNIRLEINKIDKKMKKLFIKRMELVKNIIDYKKQNNIDIYDSNRENEVIELNSNELKGSEFYDYYIEYLKDLMKTSKRYQSNYLNKTEEG